MVTTSIPRPIIVLDLPSHVPDILKIGDAVVGGVDQNPNVFQNPHPPLAQVRTNLAALSTAWTDVQQTASRSAREALKTAKQAVHKDLRVLESYAQGVLEKNDPEQAASIAALAGMRLKRTGRRFKAGFDLRNAPVSGAILVAVRAAGKHVAYEWQYSLDGGKTWIQVRSTLEARTTITGLPPGSMVLVRWRPVLRRGQEPDWSQPLSIIVK